MDSSCSRPIIPRERDNVRSTVASHAARPGSPVTTSTVSPVGYLANVVSDT
jgi:hypothetical protein